MTDMIQQAVTIVEDVAAGSLTTAEEQLLADLSAGPMTTVHLHIEVKFRAMQKDLGTITFIDHTWQWPLPGVFAKANPKPVAVNQHGIQFSIALTPPGQGTETVGRGEGEKKEGNAVAAPGKSPSASVNDGNSPGASSDPGFVGTDPTDTGAPEAPAGGDVLSQ